jgi:homocysteine S-methyltransferase
MSNQFEILLENEQAIILDGGLATELEAQGHKLDTELWSAHLLINEPEAIVAAHTAYFAAGANCAIAASYQASQQGFMKLGLTAEQAKALILKAVDLAITAKHQFVATHPDNETLLIVAASVGPYGAALGDGSEYNGDYGVSDAVLRDFHQQRLAWLDASGADVLACETIPSMQEALVLSALLSDCNTPSWVSFSCRDGRHISDGTPIAQCAALFANHPRVKAVGINCTPPHYINELIHIIKRTTLQQNIVVYPNSGETYQASDNTWHGTSTPLECGLAAQQWQQLGANIIGGCCRMGPEHIRNIKHKLPKRCVCTH